MHNPGAHRRTHSQRRRAERRALRARRPHQPLTPRTAAFTLVEMLVATGLVVLMMLLFAEIFETAIGTMRDQKSLAGNDAKARVVSSTLRGDLQRMTYRQPISGQARGLVPLVAGDTVDPRQRGFFYLSENDPFDETDDVLHFTVDLAEILRNAPGIDSTRTPFFGHALALPPQANLNQPDWDDGEFGNNAASARGAEIAYFLRGGNLYRRVLLLRDPLPSATPPFSTQPRQGQAGTGNPFPAFDQVYAPASGNSFRHDWDFSGTRVVDVDDGNGMLDVEGVDDYRFQFHGLDSLNNHLGRANYPIALPQHRFGFHPSDGRPREILLDAADNPLGYIGRLTHEETSHQAVVWPGEEPDPVIGASTANVMTSRDLTLNVNSGILYGGTLLSGPRAAEDLLLSGVDAFDVEVWDPGYREPADVNGNGQFDPFFAAEDLNGNGVRDIGAWAQLGNNSNNFSPGVYSLQNRTNPGYGPFITDNDGSATPAPALAATALNRVYDTWHPSAGRDYDGDSTIQTDEILPPYRPLRRTSADVSVAGAPGPAWSTPPAPASGDVYFPDPFGSIGFRVIAAGGITGATEPEWPRVPGAIIQDNNVTWEAFDNRVGLERIRITIRFRDAATDDPRQVTVVHSFVE